MKKLFINLLKALLFLILTSIIHVNADELFNKGKEVFLEAGNCAACHTLSDAGSNGNVGPNLNEIRPDIQRIIMAVKNGIGVMPAMEDILSTEDIEAVAHYVSISTDQ
jgi:mono/diheme cytochrome c family protein